LAILHGAFNSNWIAGTEAALDLRARVTRNLDDQAGTNDANMLVRHALETPRYLKGSSQDAQFEVGVIACRAIDHTCGCAGRLHMVGRDCAVLRCRSLQVDYRSRRKIAAEFEIWRERGRDVTTGSDDYDLDSIEAGERPRDSNRAIHLFETLLCILGSGACRRAINGVSEDLDGRDVLRRGTA
jgi:hypothetical protein